MQEVGVESVRTRRKVETCVCVFTEKTVSCHRSQDSTERGMNSRRFGVFTCCLERGGFLSEAGLDCPSSLM